MQLVRSIFRGKFAAAVTVAAVGCARPVGPPNDRATSVARARHVDPTPPTLVSPLDRDHPLAGRIWHAREHTFTYAEVVVGAIRTARFVLLGERHDNPDHHRLQAWLVEQLLACGRTPGLVFEMIDADQQPALDRYRSSGRPTVEGLGHLLAWEKRGWPSWTMYAPMAELALARRLPMHAGSLPRHVIRDLVHRGEAALDPAFVQTMRLDCALPPASERSLEAELEAAHCGSLPAEMIPGMVRAQRARDAAMAAALLSEDPDHGSVLIAGAGHARQDRGVPSYLLPRAPEARIVSVAFLQVEKDVNDPKAYASGFGSESLPFDFVWFTPRTTDENPCARMERERTK